MFKIFCTYICWIIYKMQHMEVSGAVRHIYIYIYIYVVRQLRVKGYGGERLLSSLQVLGESHEASRHSRSPGLNSELWEDKVGVPSIWLPPNVSVTLGGFQFSVLLDSVSAAKQTSVFLNIQSVSEYVWLFGSPVQSKTVVIVFDVHVTVHRDKFPIIKPTRLTNFSILFLEWNSTCFGHNICDSVHHA